MIVIRLGSPLVCDFASTVALLDFAVCFTAATSINFATRVAGFATAGVAGLVTCAVSCCCVGFVAPEQASLQCVQRLWQPLESLPAGALQAWRGKSPEPWQA